MLPVFVLVLDQELEGQSSAEEERSGLFTARAWGVERRMLNALAGFFLLRQHSDVLP